MSNDIIKQDVDASTVSEEDLLHALDDVPMVPYLLTEEEWRERGFKAGLDWKVKE